MYFKRIIPAVFAIIGIIACAQLAGGCASVSTENPDDGITIGEGQVEDSPGEEHANGENGQRRVTVDDSIRIPGEYTASERERKRKRQAEIEKIFKESQDIAEKWAEEDKKWVDKKLADAKAKEAEGNLKEAEKILGEIIDKIPEHEVTARRLVELAAKSKTRKEVKKDLEERIIALVKHARKQRDAKAYRTAYRLYIVARKLLESVDDEAVKVLMKPEIDQSIKELENLVPVEDRQAAGGKKSDK